jgi:cytochrome c2
MMGGVSVIPKCSICDKEFKNEKGLAGHLYGVHGRRVGLRADVAAAKETGEKALSLAEMHTRRLSEFLGKYDERMRKLEELLYGFEQLSGSGLSPGYIFIATKGPIIRVVETPSKA